MKALMLALGALTVAGAAHADQIVTKSTSSGTYSAPVAGATPQARENPAPDTTMRTTRTRTTVEDAPTTRVIERRTVEPEVQVRTRSSTTVVE